DRYASILGVRGLERPPRGSWRSELSHVVAGSEAVPRERRVREERTMRMSRRSVVIAFGLVAGLLATDGRGALAQEKLKLKLIFPTAPSTFGIPYFVAKEMGWLAKEGLEVEEVFMTGDANVFRSVITGDGDIALVGPAT